MKLQQQIVNGAVAGLLATGPMTVAMGLMRRWLPWRQRRPLPPHHIVRNLLNQTGLGQVEREHHRTATLIGHFGYGAAAGSLYALVDHVSGPAPMKGILYGLGVWAASYLGLLPATGLLSPATRHPAQRNMLMITAHVVWGAALGIVFAQRRQ